MANNIQQVGTTQTGVKNIFVGAEVFTLASPSDPFVCTLRMVISGATGNNPTNWTIRITQGTSVEEWSGETSGNTATTLTLNDIFLVADQAVSVTLTNDEVLDTAVTVSASLYSERMTAALQSDCPVERSLYDINPITFNFDGPSLALTGTRSINNAAYGPIDGTISYLRTEEDIDLYTLSYHVNDRPIGEGIVRYRFVETGWVPGDYERFVTLRVTSNKIGILDGDVTGKVLGGGVGTITGTGVQSQLQDDAITSAKIQDGAFTASKFAAGAFDAVWSVAARTLTSISDSAGVTTLLSRITGLIRTRVEDEVVDTTILTAIDNISIELTPAQIESLAAAISTDLGAGDATAANQQIIIESLRRVTRTQY